MPWPSLRTVCIIHNACKCTFVQILFCIPKKKRCISLLGAVASAAKATGATNALGELLDLDDVGRDDALEDELGDAVAFLDLVVGLGVVEEEHLDLAAVVGVDDARARVDEVLGGEAGAGSDAAVCVFLRVSPGPILGANRCRNTETEQEKKKKKKQDRAYKYQAGQQC